MEPPLVCVVKNIVPRVRHVWFGSGLLLGEELKLLFHLPVPNHVGMCALALTAKPVEDGSQIRLGNLRV